MRYARYWALTNRYGGNMMRNLHLLAFLLLASCHAPTADDPPILEPVASMKLAEGAPYGVFLMATKTMHQELTIRPDGSATIKSYDKSYHGVWHTSGDGEWGHRVQATLIKVVPMGESPTYEIITARLEYIDWLDSYSGNIGVPAVSLKRVQDWSPCL